jgi:hypothetical protein
MSLLSPIWLAGLIPWLAITVWLLWGQRRRVPVPFLPLWQGPVVGPRARRSIQMPPMAVAMALLAMLLGIAASTLPQISTTGAGDESAVGMIVDRGISMSAGGPGNRRFRQAADNAWSLFETHFRNAPVDLTIIPGQRFGRTTLRECREKINALIPTGVDTHSAVQAAVMARLAESKGPVLVISDQPLPIVSDRLIEIAPQMMVDDVGIAGIAACERPLSQVMVRIRNQSLLTDAQLIVTSNGQSVHRRIQLPKQGSEQDYFVDMNQLGLVVSAALDVRDDQAADKRAWLVREGSSPHIESQLPIPPELQRMIDVYQRARPATAGSSGLAVVGQLSQVPTDAPAVIIAPPNGATSTGPATVIRHPITDHVRWERLPASIQTAGEAPAGWTPLVLLGRQVLVAARPQPPRQVWIGFDAPGWASTPDYVVFWTNVFDWAGRSGGESFLGYPLNQWTAEWKLTDSTIGLSGLWPGIYVRSDGATRAFNAPAVEFTSAPHSDWRSQLSGLSVRSGRQGLAAPLLLVAMGCLLLGALAWKHGGTTRSFSSRSRIALGEAHQ